MNIGSEKDDVIGHFVIFQINIFNECGPCCVAVMSQINMQPRVNGEQAMMVITRGPKYYSQRKPERIMKEVMIEWRILVRLIQENAKMQRKLH